MNNNTINNEYLQIAETITAEREDELIHIMQSPDVNYDNIAFVYEYLPEVKAIYNREAMKAAKQNIPALNKLMTDTHLYVRCRGSDSMHGNCDSDSLDIINFYDNNEILNLLASFNNWDKTRPLTFDQLKTIYSIVQALKYRKCVNNFCAIYHKSDN